MDPDLLRRVLFCTSTTRKKITTTAPDANHFRDNNVSLAKVQAALKGSVKTIALERERLRKSK